jgi:hypothetical protein
MIPQLRNGECPPLGRVFDLRQAVEIGRIYDQRFFANGMRAGLQGHPYVLEMQVVRRANADVIDPLACRLPLADYTLSEPVQPAE